MLQTSDAGMPACMNLCQRDNDCPLHYACNTVSVAGCPGVWGRCIDVCDDPTFRWPDELRCCEGETEVAPVCINGGWMCPAAAAQFQTDIAIESCGPGRTRAESGFYCNHSGPSNHCGEEEVCCIHVVTQCQSRERQCAGFVRGCDGPEDCQPEQVCCLSLADTPSPRYRAQCRAHDACQAMDDLIACNANGVCPNGQSCCATQPRMFDVSICRPQCLSGP